MNIYYRTAGFFALIMPTLCRSESDVFDVSLTYYKSGWVPAGINDVKYETTGLDAVVFELDLTPMIDKFELPIGFFPKFKYMWTPGNEVDQKLLLEKTESLDGDNALERMFIDLPIVPLGDSKVIAINYDKAAFLASLTSESDLRYINFDGSQTEIISGQFLSQLVEFEKSTIFYGMDMPEGYSIPGNISLGIGYYMVKYQKPYSITINGQGISNDIYDTRFESDGISLLVKRYIWKDYDGSEFYFGLAAHFGKASVKFSGGQSIEQFLTESETPMFYGLNLELFCRQMFTDHLSFVFEAGYDYYDFHVGVETPDGSVTSQKYYGDLDINIDDVFFARIGLSYSI